MSTSTGTTIQTTIADYYTTILARTGSAAEIQSWVSVVDSGALTLAQVESAFIASPEAQQDVVPIIEIYQAELGRAPDAAGLAAWVGVEESGTSLATIAADIANSVEGQAFYGAPTTVNEAFLTALYQTVLGRTPDAAGLTAWLNSGLTPAQIEYAFATSAEAVARATPAADDFLASVSQGGAYGGSLYATASGGTFTLTTNADNIALTGNNNVVNGTANGSALTTPATFNTGDTITGAAGSTGNVLNLADIGEPFNGPNGIWDPTNLAGVTVSGIQTLNLNSTEGVTANTATSIEGFTGLTALNVNDAGGSTVTAAGTTAISITDLNAGTETVNGGSSVTVTTSNATDGQIKIGGTTAPTGAVTVTDGVLMAGSDTAGTISVTGGTTVSVTENLATTDTSGQSTVSGNTVTVNGTAITTSVTVNQTAPATAAVVAGANVEGVVDGTVTINDANGASSTEAGTITTVSLSNYGVGSTITDNALANLTLAGTGGGVTIFDELTTPTATTLNLSANGLTDATGITDANHEITTLNVTTGGTSASTLGQFVDSGLTTLNVSGTQAFNLGTSPSTLTAITVSGGASLSNGPGAAYQLGANTAFTSTSSGTDVVEISGPTTKTVTGNGSANEEIVWNGVIAPAAATGYLGNITGFSVLGIGSAVTSETFDLSKLTGFTGFDVEGNTNAGTITLSNVTAGSPLAIDGTFNGTLVYQTADSSGATDSLGVTLGAAANTAGFNVNALTAEDSKSVGIGTLIITSNASGTSAFDSITTLTDSSLSTLNVAGTGGLLIGGTGLTTGATSLTINGTSTGTLPITIFGVNDTALTTLNLTGTDAIALGTITDGTAGITVNGSADNANVSFALSGVTASGSTDSITLGNGTENISDLNAVAGATVNITVGNGGNNTLANTITVGDANSTITAGSGVNAITAGNGNNTITAGSGGDTISVGAGLNAITVGAGADTLNFTTAASDGSGSFYSTITGAQAGDTLNFTAGAGTGSTLSQVTGAPSTTSFATLLNDAAAASATLTTAGDMGWFQYGGNTYVVDNVNNTTSFSQGDYVVGLAGLHNLTTGATVSGIGTTDTLTLGSHFA